MLLLLMAVPMGIASAWLVQAPSMEELEDKAAVNAAAAYLGSAVYQLYRHLYRAAGENENYFALDAAACTMGVADADMKLSESRYVRCLQKQMEEKAAFPDLKPENLAATYPGRCQSMTQVLSTADARLHSLTEK